MKKQNKMSMVGKVLNILLFVSFILTMMVPITGIQIHKMASVIFLLLTIIHTIMYRKRLGIKKYFMFFIVIIAFVSGLLGMIMEQYPVIMQLHKAVSIASVFYLAIHIFIYRKKLHIC